MNDDLLALELLKIQYKNKTDIDKTILFNDYTFYIEELENKEAITKIGKIKKIFRESEGVSGSWCDVRGIQMLDKIKKIAYNEGEKN